MYLHVVCIKLFPQKECCKKKHYHFEGTHSFLASYLFLIFAHVVSRIMYDDVYDTDYSDHVYIDKDYQNKS